MIRSASQLAVILQAVGSCHFDGLYEESASEKLADDLRFCVDAVKAGHSVVRVHTIEVNSRKYPSYLPAAIKAATAGLCIVLSPGYCTTYMYDQGLLVTYGKVLADMLPKCKTVTDSACNTVISIE